MSLALGGQDPDVLRGRRLRDEASLASARPVAEREMVKLLAALHCDGPPGELEAQTKAALDAVGLLWEAAARLNQ
jgi:hypothetical protein